MTGHELDAAVLEARDPQPALSIRTTTSTARLSEVQGESLASLIASMQRRGIEPAGPPFVRYHSFDEHEADLETGIPVSAPQAADGPIEPIELPGGNVIVLWHVGSHERLGEAYVRLQLSLGEHDRQPIGPPWEVYSWIDPASVPDPATWPEPSTWRTQLVQPVR